MNDFLLKKGRPRLSIEKVSLWFGGFSDADIKSLETLGVRSLSVFYQRIEELVNLSPAFIPNTVTTLAIKPKKETLHNFHPERSGLKLRGLQKHEEKVSLRAIFLEAKY